MRWLMSFIGILGLSFVITFLDIWFIAQGPHHYVDNDHPAFFDMFFTVFTVVAADAMIIAGAVKLYDKFFS